MDTHMTAKSTAMRSAAFDPTMDVLQILPALSPANAAPVVFETERWDLTVVETWPAYSPKQALIWDTIANPTWRLAAKEVAILLLQPQIAVDRRLPLARRKPYPPWALPYQRMSYWRRWFNYLSTMGHTSLESVSQATCESFLTTITPQSRHIAITAIRDFADYADALTCGGYQKGFRPWGDLSASAASGTKGLGDAGNKTPVIPDAVFSPLIASCLHIVDTMAPTVRELSKELGRLRNIPVTRGGKPPNFDKRLEEYLEGLRAASVPLPLQLSGAGESKLNLTTVAFNLGIRDTRALQRSDRRTRIEAAVQELGLADNGIRIPGTSISRSAAALSKMTWLVRTAAYIVVAALSGLRHSELAAIERGACRREIVHGGLSRYRLQSKLLKGEPPGGKREVWTVIEPVARTLRALEEVFPGRHPLEMDRFADRYRDLVTWVRSDGADAGLAPVPEYWRTRPRQFRRTLARELAWRPNGVIAGKIHLKHVSVATTEGYAGARGESANAFLAEIEAERRMARQADTAEVIAAVQRGETIAGLGAKALRAAVAALPEADTDGAQVRDREDALIKLTQVRADTLHVTPLAYCWFIDPDLARCLRGAHDKSKPLVGSCRPDKCANATIHRDQLPVWLSGIEALRQTIGDRRVPAGERRRIGARVDEMTTAIAPLTEEQ